MNREILFKQIFQRDYNSKEADSYMEDLQTKYPWFALPHFYKLKNTGIGDKEYNKLSALTAQFFPNIYMLNQRLQTTKNLKSEITTILPKKQEHEINEVQPVIEPVIINEPVTQESYTNSKTDNTDYKEVIEDSEINHLNNFETEEQGESKNLPEIEHPAIQTKTLDIEPEAQEHEHEEMPEVEEPVIENKPLIHQDDSPEIMELSATEKSLEIAAAAFKKVNAPENSKENNSPLFEPLHATDYFASQGIKLSEDLQSKDKLGKQMKSFTDWLKVMKKTPEQQQGLQHVADERQIQNLADKSNTDAEIITESMADVYLQQNKKEKAREIYKKLSLINPDKSAYFAAKIDNLNKK